MRRRRVLLTLTAIVVGLTVLVATGDPAAADCAGPTLSYETVDAAPGDSVRVEGLYFGDNCYDTGPPPEGEDVLGRPIPDIEILVLQGDNEWTVATGDAGADYSFAVEITLPVDLVAGEAQITGRWGEGQAPYIDPRTGPVEITGEAAAEATFVVADFSITASIPAEPAASSDSDDGTNRGPLIAAGIVIALLAIVGLVLLPNRT